MAHKKAGGSSRNGRDSAGLGMGKDHTIFAVVEGNVKFHTGLKRRQFISVVPMAEAAE